MKYLLEPKHSVVPSGRDVFERMGIYSVDYVGYNPPARVRVFQQLQQCRQGSMCLWTPSPECVDCCRPDLDSFIVETVCQGGHDEVWLQPGFAQPLRSRDGDLLVGVLEPLDERRHKAQRSWKTAGHDD